MSEDPRIQAAIEAMAKVPLSPLVPVPPTGKQRAFLANMGKEAFYGGTARSMKSWAALMAALQFECVPGYAAMIFRKERTSLVLPDGLIPISQQWLGDQARWNGENHQWIFPSGATLNFGYLQNTDDLLKYHSSSYSFILFEELPEWPTDAEYLYMFSRLTSKVDADGRMPRCKCHGWSVADIPVRMRGTGNPGGPGMAWVKQRFIAPWRAGEKPGIFHPASYKDNPYINHAEYEDTVSRMRKIDQMRLIGSDWDVASVGDRFMRSWFTEHRGETRLIDPNDKNGHWQEILPTLSIVRRWDLATTRPNKQNKDPDWTAGALVGHRKIGGEDEWYLIHVARFRATAAERNDLMRKQAARDDKWCKRRVKIRVEREPGAQARGGLKLMKAAHFSGLDFRGVPSRIRKEDRIDALAAACEDGEVWTVLGDWNGHLFDEAEMYGHAGVHDDQLDAIAGAMHDLGRGGTGKSSGRVQREIDANAELIDGGSSMAYPSTADLVRSVRAEHQVGGFESEMDMAAIMASFDRQPFG